MILIFTFLLLLAILLKFGKNELISISILYYCISLIPFLLIIKDDEKWRFFFWHVLQNNLLICVAFFIVYSFKPGKLTILIAPAYFKIINKKLNLTHFYIISSLIIFVDLVFVVGFEKPFIIKSILEGSIFQDRVNAAAQPFPINLWFNNYYGILLLCLSFNFSMILKNQNTYTNFLLFFGLSLIYLSMMKKSAILMLGMCITLLIVKAPEWGVKKKFWLLTFVAGIIVTILFTVSAQYYVERDLFIAIMNRLLFESIRMTQVFYDIYGELSASLDLVPSFGSGILGFEGRSLERELFYELFSNRVNRYGNSPVLSYTYGDVALGGWNPLYFAILYILYFRLCYHFHTVSASNNTAKSCLKTTLAIYFMPIFLSGGFKVVSIFVIYPLGLALTLLMYRFLPDTRYLR